MALGFSAQAQSLDEGIKLVKYERYESAKKILAPMAAGNATANYYLGLADLGLEDVAAAKADFAKFPQDAANMAGMARVAYTEKNTAEGNRLTKVVADGAKKKEWEPLKFAADAITYTTGGDYQQAITWYKAALAKNDNADLHISLGDAYLKTTGGGGEAMNNYEAVTGKDPKNSLAYSRIGDLWYAAKKYDLALENFNKAKDADPSNPLPYRSLANAYFWVGKYDLAKQNIEKYLELSDKSTEDKMRYADILYLAKDYPNAIAKIQELQSSGVTKPYMYRLLAYSQYETKDYANALQNINTFFAKQDPAKIIPLDYLYQGKILIANGQTDAGEAALNKAVAADTSANKAETYRQIADLYKDMKTEDGYKKAGMWYGKVTSETPNPQVLDYYYSGFWSYYGKNYDYAASQFEKMEAKFPDQPSAPYWRGRVAAAIDSKGETGAAAPYFTKWLAIADNERYTKKPADQIIAYQYLALSSYNKGDKTAAKGYMDKLEALDPNDKLLAQLKGLMSKPTATKAPAAPKKK